MSYNYHYTKALRELADGKQAPRVGMSHNYHYAKVLRELADGKQAPRMSMSHNYHYAKPLRELADSKLARHSVTTSRGVDGDRVSPARDVTDQIRQSLASLSCPPRTKHLSRRHWPVPPR